MLKKGHLQERYRILIKTSALPVPIELIQQWLPMHTRKGMEKRSKFVRSDNFHHFGLWRLTHQCNNDGNVNNLIAVEIFGCQSWFDMLKMGQSCQLNRGKDERKEPKDKNDQTCSWSNFIWQRNVHQDQDDYDASQTKRQKTCTSIGEIKSNNL